jgi:hypothetical protein
MGSQNDKWIRSIKDNPAGKVVADPNGNRWEWESSDDGTTRLLNKLANDELSIEQTDIAPPTAKRGSRETRAENKVREEPRSRAKRRSGGRDAGGGFNPYDNSGKRSHR